MKKMLVIFVLFLTQNAFCQAGGSQTGTIKYIAADSFVTNSRINISDVNDFIQLLNEKKVETVFISNDTFVFEFNSILYTIPTNGYKTLNDFSTAKTNNFLDSESYYLAVAQGLSSQAAVDAYRLAQEKNRQDLELANSLGFISIEDHRTAMTNGFLNPESNRNYQSVIGLLSKADLQKSIYHLNVLLDLPVDSNDVINNPEKYTGRIYVYGNYYYISINIRVNSNSRYITSDGKYYYACRLAQYNTANEFLAGSSNTTQRNVINIKGSETVSKELNYETYDDCVSAIRGGFLNSSDYYFAKKYRITSNTVLTANRNILNELEIIKQNYSISNDGYSLFIYFTLQRQKGIPVSLEIFQREFTEWHRTNYSSRGGLVININQVIFEKVYAEVERFRSIIMYDQSGGSFYLR